MIVRDDERSDGGLTSDVSVLDSRDCLARNDSLSAIVKAQD